MIEMWEIPKEQKSNRKYDNLVVAGLNNISNLGRVKRCPQVKDESIPIIRKRISSLQSISIASLTSTRWKHYKQYYAIIRYCHFK